MLEMFKKTKFFLQQLMMILVGIPLLSQLALANSQACVKNTIGFPLDSRFLVETQDTIGELDKEDLVCSPVDVADGTTGEEHCANCSEVKASIAEKEPSLAKSNPTPEEEAIAALKGMAKGATGFAKDEFEPLLHPSEFFSGLWKLASGAVTGLANMAGEEFSALGNTIASAVKSENGFFHAMVNHESPTKKKLVAGMKIVGQLISQGFSWFGCAPPLMQTKMIAHIATQIGLNVLFMAVPMGLVGGMWIGARRGLLPPPLEKIASTITKVVSDFRLKFGLNRLLKPKSKAVLRIADDAEAAAFKLAKAKGRTPGGVFVGIANDGTNLVLAKRGEKILKLNPNAASTQTLTRLARNSRLVGFTKESKKVAMSAKDRINGVKAAAQAKRAEKVAARRGKALRKEYHASHVGDRVDRRDIPKGADFGSSGVAVADMDGARVVFYKKGSTVYKVSDEQYAVTLAEARNTEMAWETIYRQTRAGLPKPVSPKDPSRAAVIRTYVANLAKNDLGDEFEAAVRPLAASKSVARQLHRQDTQLFYTAQKYFGNAFGEETAAFIGAKARRLAKGDPGVAKSLMEKTALTFARHPDAATDLLKTFRYESSPAGIAEILNALERNAANAMDIAKASKKIPQQTKRALKLRDRVANSVRKAVALFRGNPKYRRVVKKHAEEFRKTSPDVDEALVNSVAARRMTDNGGDIRRTGDDLSDIKKACRARSI